MANPMLKFNCPKCKIPTEVEMPTGEVVSGVVMSVAAWPNKRYTCPNCLGVFVTQLSSIPFEGMVWGIREIQERSIIAPPHVGIN